MFLIIKNNEISVDSNFLKNLYKSCNIYLYMYIYIYIYYILKIPNIVACFNQKKVG